MAFSSKLIITLLIGLILIVLFMLLGQNTQTPVEQNTTGHSVGEFSNLVPFTLGRISLLGSIASNDADRQLGLSNTKDLPIGVAKVFIFDTTDTWSFWMKDMNYSIDIFWLDESGRVVHIVENANPDTYPDISFVPPVPARYVIETKAGFAQENNIRIGESAGMTQILGII